VISIRSLTAPARRSLVALLVVVLAVLFTAAPANAAKPAGPSATTTLSKSVWVQSATGCSFDATYTWAGFKGRDLNISVRLLDQSGNALAVAPQVTSVPGGGSFTFIFTFAGSGGAPRGMYARAALLKSGAEVSGSVASSPVVSSTCTGPISIGWVSTIPLT